MRYGVNEGDGFALRGVKGMLSVMKVDRKTIPGDYSFCKSSCMGLRKHLIH